MRRTISPLSLALPALFACSPELLASEPAPLITLQEVSPPAGSAADEVSCFRVTVTDDFDAKSRKYTVANGPDHYVRFRFYAPWQGPRYIKSIRPYVDNEDVFVRGRLFSHYFDVGPGVEPSDATNPETDFLFGWSRSSDTLELTADIGIPLPAGALFSLEHHYDNRGGAPAEDRSGMVICVTQNAPIRPVGMAWLGADTFAGDVATGQCTPMLRRPAQVLPVAAYTRAHGVEAKVVWTHADGSTETVFDEKLGAQAANSSSRLPPPLTFRPGDKLTVRCRYDGPVQSGISTSAEACELYVLHSPPGVIYRDSAASKLHGGSACID